MTGVSISSMNALAAETGGRNGSSLIRGYIYSLYYTSFAIILTNFQKRRSSSQWSSLRIQSLLSYILYTIYVFFWHFVTKIIIIFLCNKMHSLSFHPLRSYLVNKKVLLQRNEKINYKIFSYFFIFLILENLGGVVYPPHTSLSSPPLPPAYPASLIKHAS